MVTTQDAHMPTAATATPALRYGRMTGRKPETEPPEVAIKKTSDGPTAGVHFKGHVQMQANGGEWAA